jgi:hypothetical protein
LTVLVRQFDIGKTLTDLKIHLFTSLDGYYLRRIVRLPLRIALGHLGKKSLFFKLLQQ